MEGPENFGLKTPTEMGDLVVLISGGLNYTCNYKKSSSFCNFVMCIFLYGHPCAVHKLHLDKFLSSWAHLNMICRKLAAQ